jgi:nucleotide-binding universal stress UspA family protein
MTGPGVESESLGQYEVEVSTSDQAIAVVVGYDGSDAARRALEQVRALGPRGSRIVVVAVASELRSAGLSSQLADDLQQQPLLDEARALLGVAEGARVETRAEVGDPAVVLVDVARAVAAELLVVGRRGGDFVARTLLGSVAERIVRHAPCDVLVVR